MVRHRHCFLTLILALSPLLAAQTPPAQITVRSNAASMPLPQSLKFPPLRPVHIPKPTVFTLSNGLKIFLLENHELPLIRGAMIVRTGDLFDPADKRGLAKLTGVTLRSGGTQAFTSEQLNQKLESVAASIETSIGESTGGANFQCLKNNTAEVLQLFHDVITSPAFRQDKIDLAKTQLKSEISRRNDDAAGIANRELFRMVYGPDTPYGAMEEYATVDAITRSDIEAFYKRYFFPSNILMSVYGDFSTSEMESALRSLFGSWSAAAPKAPPFPPVDAPPRPGLFFVQKPDIGQTFIVMGELGGEYRDKDFPALSVAADVLGGGFGSRLMREIRARLGYVYSIDASWDADFIHPGIFRISCSTQPSTTTSTIQAILHQLAGLRSEEITDQELETAKNSALNSLVFAFERPSSSLARLITYQYFDYPSDFLDRYQKAVAKVTKADVLRVAKKHFLSDKLTIVAVGDRDNLGQPLSILNLPVKELDVSIPPPTGAIAPQTTSHAPQNN